MGDIKDEGEVSDPVARARVSISCKKTLALRKVLGSGSDATLKCQILAPGIELAVQFTLQLMASFQGECAIQFQDYSVAKVISMMRLEFQATGPRYGMTDVEVDYVSSETLALRKELGSGSDATGKSMHMIRLRREFGFNSDGECAIQFQDYSVAKVISMMRLEFQATGPR
ncbi:Calmodulin-Like Protein 5 [Manis pentadactyla]|nr:Calmodulin-Like Protein 5 [Manis pentadactyla]